MGPLVDPFLDNEFMMRALVAGALVALACAVVGTFVVLRTTVAYTLTGTAIAITVLWFQRIRQTALAPTPTVVHALAAAS